MCGIALAVTWNVTTVLRRYFDRAATAMLVALVATAAAMDGKEFAGFARLTAVGAGGLAAWRGVPFVFVVLIAAACAALLRAIGIA